MSHPSLRLRACARPVSTRAETWHDGDSVTVVVLGHADAAVALADAAGLQTILDTAG
jgi:hypothetical protein